MNQLTISGSQAATMSSREIAELTGKNHADVMRDVRRMLEELHGEGGLSNFASSYINSQNKEQPEYQLPKREALILTSGYSVKQRAAIIDRWQELEARPAIDPMQILSDPAAMRGLLLTYTEKVLALESKVADDAPKVAALERIALSDGMIGLQAAGKVLQQPPNKFVQWLRENGWIFRRPGNRNNHPHVDKINAGYMAMKATTVTYPDGTDRTFEQAMLTPKGLTKLAKSLGVASACDFDGRGLAS